MKYKKIIQLTILLIVFLLLASLVFAAEVRDGVEITESTTWQGVSLKNFDGKTPQIIGDTMYIGNAPYLLDNNNGERGLYDYSGTLLEGKGEKNIGEWHAPPKDAGSSGQTYGRPSVGETNRVVITRTTYVDPKTGKVGDHYMIENDGYNYKLTTDGGTIIRYTSNSPLNGLAWSEVPPSAITSDPNYVTVQVKIKGEVKTIIYLKSETLGEEGTEYSLESTEGFFQYKYGKKGTPLLVYEEDTTNKVNGQTIEVGQDYGRGVATVPSELAGGNEDLTVDLDIYKNGKIDWDLTRKKNDGNLWVDENKRFEIPDSSTGTSYLKTKVGNDWNTDTQVTVRNIPGGRERTTVRGSTAVTERDFGGGNKVTVKQEGDTVNKLVINRPGEDAIFLDNQDARNYLGGRTAAQMDQGAMDEIGFVYERLGREAVYGNLDKDYYAPGKHIKPDQNNNLVYEKTEAGEGVTERETLARQDGNIQIGGRTVPANKGDLAKEKVEDGNVVSGTVEGQDGSYTHIYDGESGALTTISIVVKGKEKIRVYATKYNERTYTQIAGEDIFVTNQGIGGTGLRTFNDDGDALVYIDGKPYEVSDVINDNGELYSNFEGKAILNSPSGRNIAHEFTGKEITKKKLKEVEDEAEKGIDQNEDAESKDKTKEDKNRRRRAAAGSKPPYTGIVGVASDLLKAYRPMHELSNLLLEATGNEAWLTDVDNFFARNYLGVDAVASDLCMNMNWFKYDYTEDNQHAAIETSSGLVQFIGHVEGERSSATPIVCATSQECVDFTKETSAKCQDGLCRSGSQIMTQYFYKITTSVIAPADEKQTPYKKEDQAITFNIFISGPSGTINLYKDDIALDNGQGHSEPFVQYSANVYDKVCIRFTDKKPVTVRPGKGTATGDDIKEVCNSIVGTERSLVNFENSAIPAAAPGGGFNSI